MSLFGRQQRERIILAFDLDNFYVASERLRDPSLIGKPVAIQQKTITATCSYEARERGVRKLCLIGDAKRMCPDLIIINGEDLTFYRRDSRRIWRLVNALIGQQPERLGMDELFLDVTALVSAHLANEVDRKARFFRLSRSGEPARGFSYSDGPAGVVMPSSGDAEDPENLRYAVASHVAAHIRERIAQEVGFTTSGGIAPNKLLAKLLASENKPAKQTVWLPPNDPMEKSKAAEDYMALIPVRNLNGFGHRIVQTLRSKISGEPVEEDSYWTEPLAGLEEEKWEPENVRIEESPLLVGQVREATSLNKFESWFGERLGSKLWAMLWGRDDEPVVPAPEYPAQISVEDSYLRAKLPTVALALQKITTLAISLLTRLEAELVDEPASLLPPTNTRTWARHPTQLRLSLRGGPGAGSKTIPMPLDILDLHGIAFDDRAQKLAQAFHALFRKMIPGQGRDSDKTSLHVINLAVVAFQANAPTPSVKTLLGSKRPSPRKPTEAHAYVDESDEDEDGDDGREQCGICDLWLPAFVLPAHLQYHIEEG